MSYSISLSQIKAGKGGDLQQWTESLHNPKERAVCDLAALQQVLARKPKSITQEWEAWLQ